MWEREARASARLSPNSARMPGVGLSVRQVSINGDERFFRIWGREVAYCTPCVRAREWSECGARPRDATHTDEEIEKKPT
eukprot:5321447-Prymnesium_polylepis.1